MVANGALGDNTAPVLVPDDSSLALGCGGAHLDRDIVVSVGLGAAILHSSLQVRAHSNLLPRDATIRLATLLTCRLFLCLPWQLSLLGHVDRGYGIING